MGALTVSLLGLLGSIGYLFNEGRGAATGVMVVSAVMLIAEFWDITNGEEDE